MTEGRGPEAEDELARQHEADGGGPDDLEPKRDVGDMAGVPVVAMSGVIGHELTARPVGRAVWASAEGARRVRPRAGLPRTPRVGASGLRR